MFLWMARLLISGQTWLAIRVQCSHFVLTGLYIDESTCICLLASWSAPVPGATINGTIHETDSFHVNLYKLYWTVPVQGPWSHSKCSRTAINLIFKLNVFYLLRVTSYEINNLTIGCISVLQTSCWHNWRWGDMVRLSLDPDQATSLPIVSVS